MCRGIDLGLNLGQVFPSSAIVFEEKRAPFVIN